MHSYNPRGQEKRPKNQRELLEMKTRVVNIGKNKRVKNKKSPRKQDRIE